MKLPKVLIRVLARFYLGNPYMGDWITERYSTLKTYVKLIFNQLLYVFRSDLTPFLLSINIDPINRCNLKCKSCRGYFTFPPTDDGMSLDFFKQIISEIPHSVENVNLSMYSEPLLHPHIFEMIHITARAGFRPTIFTNGTLITESVAERLLKAPLDSINLSMEVDEQNSLEWRGISQKKSEEILALLLRTKKKLHSPVKIKISLVAHASNSSQLKAFIQKMKYQVDGIKVSPMIIRKKGEKKKACSELWRGNLTIFSNGDCIPCCGDFSRELNLGSLKSGTIMQIWKGTSMRKLRTLHRVRKFPPVCANCSIDKSVGLNRFKN